MAFHASNPPAPRGDWFSKLFGFSEESYDEVRRWLRIVRDPANPDAAAVLESLASGARYGAGAFETPSLAELRARGAGITLPGQITVKNELGDVAAKHALPENRYATFQVASQFNCLEFVGPSVVPEDGVTRYVGDRTQGPACSIACGPATVFRNYFACVASTPEQEGQTRHCQIDNLADMSRVLGNVPQGKFFDVRGGYTLANQHQLALLNEALRRFEQNGALDEVRATLRLGVHADAQVTATDWGRSRVHDAEQKVTQVFGSACAVAYNSGRSESWQAFATLVLEASYEATLWAALLNAARHRGAAGSRRVFLTCLGGGVFGNALDWIMQAMRRAVCRFAHSGLDIRIVTYAGKIAPQLIALEREFSAERALQLPQPMTAVVADVGPWPTASAKTDKRKNTHEDPRRQLTPEKLPEPAAPSTASAHEQMPSAPDTAKSGAAAFLHGLREQTVGLTASPLGSSKQNLESAASPGSGRAAKVAKTSKVGPVSKADVLVIESIVLDEARTLGFEAALRNLVDRPDVIACGVSHVAALNALKASDGLVNPAKRALLAANAAI